MKRNQLACALTALLLAPVAGTAFAQSSSGTDAAAAAPAGNTKQLQTITVTGSAIPRIDTETSSPVTVITAQQIERSGFTTISDVVRSISADNSGSIPNSFTNGFAAGSSGVALRGLTVNSTLVLIDGQRSASYALSDDGQRSFVDLNTIPLAAVERVEVLKDGASSLYGADAIAGVVNIILRPGYQGVQITADVGNSAHGGGFSKKSSILAGTGDLNKDHYNAYFSAEYEEDNAIQAGSRGFPYNTSDLSRIGGPNQLAGNPSQDSGSTVGSVTPANGGLSQPLGACVGGTSLVSNPQVGSWCQQNQVAQYDQLQAKTEHGGVYSRFTVKINDTTKAYISASYMEDKTWTVGAPQQIQNSSPNNTNNITLPAVLANGQLNPNNPFAAQGQAALINYAFGDIPQGTNYDNKNFRLVGDLAGQLGEWNYDATAVINHTSLDSQQFGDISYTALLNAINTGSYNFINPSSNSSAVRAALAPGYDKTSTSDLDSLSFAANRELWDLPGGALGLAVGAQLRHEAQNDPTLNPNFEFQGLGNSFVNGSRDVGSTFFEVDAPLLQSLEADVSGRYDHYSDFGGNFSPKLGLKWKPTDWLALRGTYSKGFRAPSFAEAGDSGAQGFISNYTPPQSFVDAHGNNGYVQPYTYTSVSGANKNIKPEKSTNYTFGIVLQPTSWLNASVDYYHIKKTDVITTSDIGDALADYYAGTPLPAGVQVIPDRPDPANPNAQARPIEVIGEYINGQSLQTDGMDVDLQAHFAFDNGIKWTSELSGTDIFSWVLVLPGGVSEQFAGTHGPFQLSSGAGTPKFRESWANTIEYGPVTVTGTFYHTSGMKNVAADAGNDGECLSFVESCRVGSFTEFDLTGSYAFTSKISLTASIMNAFDRKAPLDAANYAAANYNPTYAQDGAIGRFYNLGVKIKL
jgi:iron complex outermembrane receptor protein